MFCYPFPFWLSRSFIIRGEPATFPLVPHPLLVNNEHSWHRKMSNVSLWNFLELISLLFEVKIMWRTCRFARGQGCISGYHTVPLIKPCQSIIWTRQEKRCVVAGVYPIYIVRLSQTALQSPLISKSTFHTYTYVHLSTLPFIFPV